MGKRTLVGNFLHSTWINLNIRCGNGLYNKHATQSKSKYYTDVKILFTREEFKEFCWSNKTTIECLTRPSLDRINAKDHYTLNNIQIIELAENIAKEKLKSNNGKCICYCCKEIKDIHLFEKDKRRVTGHSTLCIECGKENRRLKYIKNKHIKGSTDSEGTNE